MSEQRDNRKLQDIAECINRIELYTTGMDYDTFMEDIKTQDAVVRNLEIIGEAVKKLSDEFKEENNHVSWREIGKLRDKLIHHYFGINFDIVWSIIQNDVPVLDSDIAGFL